MSKLQKLEELIGQIEAHKSVGFNDWQKFGDVHLSAFTEIIGDQEQWGKFVDLTNRMLDKTEEGHRLSGKTPVPVAENIPGKILVEVMDRKEIIARKILENGMGDLLNAADIEAVKPRWIKPTTSSPKTPER